MPGFCFWHTYCWVFVCDDDDDDDDDGKINPFKH